MDVVTELAASDGRLQGYVKPVIYNLDVFEWRADADEAEADAALDSEPAAGSSQ